MTTLVNADEWPSCPKRGVCIAVMEGRGEDDGEMDDGDVGLIEKDGNGLIEGFADGAGLNGITNIVVSFLRKSPPFAINPPFDDVML
mmetsp:Transcript_33336/g.56698  ORF Transcript_33336/g.56698 Transcript_33336/m.56698 type:complete len:87 (+) Transcript_33336:92-352(+)